MTQRPDAVGEQSHHLARGNERNAQQRTLQRVDDDEDVKQRRPVSERRHEAEHPTKSHHHRQLHADHLCTCRHNVHIIQQ